VALAARFAARRKTARFCAALRYGETLLGKLRVSEKGEPYR
jgi:hypothetical protein